MKLPWSNPSEKSSPPLVALSQLPIAAWGKTDPATLVRDGYSGNAVVYRCVRMIAEAAASITFQASDEHVQSMMLEPSADDAGQTLFERLYTDIQITGNAWLEAVTLPDQSEPRALFSLRPNTVRVHKDKVGQISGYGVKLKRGERIIGRDPDGWSPVLHLKLYHPGDSTYGLSPLSAARKSLDVHNGAAGWAKALNDARARLIADRQYHKLHLANTLTLSLPPDSAIALEVADLVTYEDTPWRIERIETSGLESRFLLRDASRGFLSQRALNAPAVLEPISVAAQPDFVIIDGPALAQNAVPGPVVAISGTPWAGAIPVQVGVSETAMITAAIADQPAGLGRIGSGLSAGPLGRWDKSACIELDIPEEGLSSAEGNAVLSGANRLLVEHAEGWEMIAYREAELVSENRWRLTHLLRGLSGTPIRETEPDVVAIRVDDRLVSVPLGEEQVEVPLIWQVGEGDTVEFTYQDRASDPWRIGHLRGVKSGARLKLSWTPRGLQYASNWTLPDDPQEDRFRIETFSQNELVSRVEQSDAVLEIPLGTADTVRIAPIGLHQRLGEWVSIPLPPP